MKTRPGGYTCPQCQASNFSGDIYCFNCGTKLEEEEDTITYPGDSAAAAEPPDFFNLPPGTQFAGRYQIIEELGSGSMGRVFKAKDQKLDLTVALKMIHPEYSSSPAVIDLFKRETLLARSLSQENIIRIYDLGESRGLTFISMEYFPGQNLEHLLRTSGTLTEATAVSITRQICRALTAAHKRGIVHRDLKPQNILIDPNGRVRVADFGLARTFEAPAGSASDRIVGTPAYMSPEQALGQAADARSDIYSLGVILYEMLTGRKPFISETMAGYLEKHIHEKPKAPRTLNPKLSPHLERTILGCLEKDPEKRIASAGGVLQTLEERKPPAAAGGTKLILLTPVRIVAAAAAFGLAAIGLYLFVLRKPDIRPPPLPGDRTSVAVMYFEDNTGDPGLEYLRKTLPHQIIYDLLQSVELRVVTPDQLSNVLKDLRLADNKTYTTDDLKKVAERAQVRYILPGNYAKFGGVFKINALLLDTATWDQVGTVRDEVADFSQLNAMVERITPKIKSDLHRAAGRVVESAAVDLDRITTGSPDALKFYVNGDEFFLEGKIRESNDAYQKAIGLDPAFALAYFRLANTSFYLGNRAEAKTHLEKALSLAGAGRASPRDRQLFLGFYASAFGTSIREAVDHYQALLALYPDDKDGLIYLGSLYRNLEEWSLAQDCFERLVRLDKFNPVTYINLSMIYMARGLYAEAANILPSNPAYLSESLRRRSLGLVRLSQGRYDEALAEIEKALKLEPGRPGFLLIRGHVRQLKGDIPSAESDYRELSRNPDPSTQTTGLRYLVFLALQEGRFQDFRSLVLRGINLSKDAGLKDDEYAYQLLEALEGESRGAYKPAEQAALQAARLAEEMKDINYQVESLEMLGVILAAQGKRTEAGKAGERIKRLIDESGRNYLLSYYYHLMGMIALAGGDLAEAADDCRKAAEGLPFQYGSPDRHASYDESQAKVAEKAGDIDKAISHYRDILARTTGRLGSGDVFVRSYYRLGKLYLKKNQRAEAADAFETFLRLWAGADPGLAEAAEARAELAALKPLLQTPASKKAPAA